MRSLFLTLLIVACCLAPTRVWADDNDSENTTNQFPTGLVYGLHVGVNLVSSFTGGGLSTVNRIGFQAGLDGKYYFAPNVGLASGLQFVSRGVGTNGAFFLDIPLALSFRYGGLMAKDSGFSYMDLGGFASIPFANISASFPTKFGAGLYVGGGTLFKVTESFRMGFASWFKFGLANSINSTTANNILELGIGIISLF
ncbi:MAG: hypothetical protein KDD51_12335 [Bdellovibrionales bacterium]|nr:hypothetical protein [Bdellovibrionales bacterium]